MNAQLKKEIILWMFNNQNEFQLVNATINKFRAYIYDNEGEYLIGGEEVSKFITDSNKLIF